MTRASLMVGLIVLVAAGCGGDDEIIPDASPDALVADAAWPDASEPDAAESDAVESDAGPADAAPDDAPCIADGGTAGVFEVSWILDNGSVVSCATAGADNVTIISEGDNVGTYMDIFDCDDDLPVVTAPLPFDSYTVSAVARDIEYNDLGTSDTQQATLGCQDFVSIPEFEIILE